MVQPYSQPLFWKGGVNQNAIKYWFNGLPEPGVIVTRTSSGIFSPNVLPAYVRANNRRTSGPSLTPITNALPTANIGDLIICAFGPYTDFGQVNQTYTVSAPWQICATYNSGTNSARYLAYAYHSATLVLPTWTVSGGAADNYQSQLFVFSGAKITASPTGAVQGYSINSATTPVPVSSITATGGNSLALLVHFNRGSQAPPWPPAGWTDLGTGILSNELWLATKPLVNIGDTSGSVSLAYTVAVGGAALINIEILANPLAGDFYFNGLPEQLIKG